MALRKSFALESPPAQKKKKRHEFPSEIFCQTGTLISTAFFLLAYSKGTLISLWQHLSTSALLTFWAR